MKPINQTRFETRGENGNCAQAAIASLLELPLEAVPNFIETNDYDGSMKRFLAERGLRLVRRSPDSFARFSDRYYLATGPSPQGYEHMVIYYAGTLAHDPFPFGRGLVREDALYFVEPL